MKPAVVCFIMQTVASVLIHMLPVNNVLHVLSILLKGHIHTSIGC